MAMGDHPPGGDRVQDARPSSVSSHAPSPRAINGDSGVSACWVKGCQTGEASDHAKSPVSKLASKAAARLSRVKRIEQRQPAQAPAPCPSRDDAFAFLVVVADEGHAEQRDVAGADRFDRQQAVVDGAQRWCGRRGSAAAPAREHIDEQRVCASAAPSARPRLRSPQSPSRRRQRIGIDDDAFRGRGLMRRGRQLQTDMLPAESRRRPARATVSLSVSGSSPACTGFQ